MNKIAGLRLTACIIWVVSGIMSHSIEGYMSAGASILFIVALFLDMRDQNV
mgnify:CR=1 FL=1